MVSKTVVCRVLRIENEFSKLSEGLKLNDEEKQEIVILDELFLDLEEKWKRCLIALLL